jgi:hypothetical protein
VATPLLEERIDPTEKVAVFLDADCVSVATHNEPEGEQTGFVELRPATFDDAKKLSIALRRAQRRIEAIGAVLAEQEGR